MKKYLNIKNFGIIVFGYSYGYTSFHFYENSNLLNLSHGEVYAFILLMALMLYASFNIEFSKAANKKLLIVRKLFLVKLSSACIYYCCSKVGLDNEICFWINLLDMMIQLIVFIFIVEFLFEISHNIKFHSE
jgi:hypothetical protein